MARKLAFDRLLFAAVLLMVGLGLVMVYSASAVVARSSTGLLHPFMKQCFAAALGLGIMLVVMHIDYRHLQRPLVVYAAVAGVLVMLVAVLFAPALNNSRRWLFLGGLSIQPSELAKLMMVIFVAYQIDRKADRLNSYALLVPCAFVTALTASLILFGRDLGTAVLVCLPAFLMVFIAGLSLRYLLLGAGMLTPIVAIAVLSEPYRLKRVFSFLSPEDDPLGTGFQVLQSLIAVGSGGLFGLGPGNSIQKLYFLPSPHADFIFSIVAEELGFVGATFLLALVGILLWRGVIAGQRAPEDFGRYLAWGVTCMVVVQALIHVSVALGLLPTTGIPLPLVSHGGSSMVTMLTACGLLLNVSQHG